MSVRTTINMHISTKKKIANAARTLDTTQKDIVIMLLHCMLMDYKKLQTCFKGVRYQDSDEKNNWIAFQIRFSGIDYEFFTDERKFYKISVSFLVALATRIYLKKLLHSKRVHNYVTTSEYSIRNVGSILKLRWIITWNQPDINKLQEIIT